MTWKHIVFCAAAVSLAACGDNSSTTATAPGPATSPATAGAVSAATAAITDAVAQVKAEADKLIADATQYIKDNKLDLADKAVTSLQDMKAKLPAEYGPRIDQLKKMLDDAKSALSKIPTTMKLP